MNITHDFHIHTNLSLCAADQTGTVEGFVESAKVHGLTKLGFANHFWGSEPGDPEYYKKTRWDPTDYYLVQNYEHIARIRPELDAVNEEGIKVYFGAECEYDPFKKSIAVSKDHVESFDFLIVPNSHTHMMMPQSLYYPYEKHIDFMFDAFYNIINCEFSAYITSIAHPFCAVCAPYDRNELSSYITDDRYKKAFDLAANKGIAIEINVFNISKEPADDFSIMNEQIRMFKAAKECGCKFTFGSDAHTLSEHKNYGESVKKMAELLELKEDDIADIAK